MYPRAPSLPTRAAAALLASVLVLALAYVLRGKPILTPDPRLEVVSVRVIVNRVPRAAMQPPAPPVSRPGPPRQRATPAAAPAPRTEPVPPIETDSVVVAAPVERPARAAEPVASASAPIDLGDAVIRSAVARSKGAVRKLADASGQALDPPKPSKDEFLAVAIAQAGVPDCLRDDGLKRDPPVIGPIAFSGVLAVPFVVHAAVTGKCKP